MRPVRFLAPAVAMLALASAVRAGDVKGVLKLERVSDAERTVVYVESVPEGTRPPNVGDAKLSQKGARFRPPLLTVVKGSVVDVTNDDWVSHSIFSKSKTKTFDLGIYGQDVKKSLTFDTPGVVEVFCSIHPRMSAEILVLQNGFFVKPGSDGSFLLTGVPAGKRQLVVYRMGGQTRSSSITVPATGAVEAAP
jgi:plastocyanin